MSRKSVESAKDTLREKQEQLEIAARRASNIQSGAKVARAASALEVAFGGGDGQGFGVASAPVRLAATAANAHARSRVKQAEAQVAAAEDDLREKEIERQLEVGAALVLGVVGVAALAYGGVRAAARRARNRLAVAEDNPRAPTAAAEKSTASDKPTLLGLADPVTSANETDDRSPTTEHACAREDLDTEVPDNEARTA